MRRLETLTSALVVLPRSTMFQDIQAFQHLQNLHSGVGFHIPHANHKDWLNKEHHCYPSHHW